MDNFWLIYSFLDFYRIGNPSDSTLRYLVFDSKFTPYKNLRRLDDKNIKFITIRRRGRNIVDRIEHIPNHLWKEVRVIKADGKGRILKVFEEKTKLNEYGKKIRQIAIKGHGKIKPALLITNDFEIKLEYIIKKYSRRWLVEKEISEQIDFFHLNRVSSSMVIKVDFDFTMTILAHNLYRLFAQNLPGYSHCTDNTIYEKFLYNSGNIEIKLDEIIVKLKKKRNLPLLLTEIKKYSQNQIYWFQNRKVYNG